MNPEDTYEVRTIHRERNEDGDIVLTWEVIARGFAGAKDFMKRFDRQPEYWTAVGDGFLKATYFTAIDGVEYAIEQSNDAWAQRQQDIEDRGSGLGYMR